MADVYVSSVSQMWQDNLAWIVYFQQSESYKVSIILELIKRYLIFWLQIRIMNQTEEKGLVKKQQTIIACIKKKKSLQQYKI